MQKFSVCIIDTNSNNIEKALQSLENNSNYVFEILYCGEKNIPQTKHLTTNTSNEATCRNLALQKAKSDYICFLNSDIELEEESFEEFAEIIEEYPDADIIYPNEVFIMEQEEEIKNYEDWYQKEMQLLPSLAIEDYLAQWGVVVKKQTIQKLGGFESKYGEHSWYGFIYKNLANIRLKLSELSFINHYLTQTFIDTSYRSLLVRDIIKIYPLQEIFTSLDWSNENIALATANTLIGDRLAKYYDFFNASKFYRNALLAFHNQATLKKLLDAYIQMGLFQEAKTLLQTQDATKEIVNEYQETIENTEKLIKELEKVIEEGKAAEILPASKEIISFYEGAPIYNIFGVIFFMQQDLENSYKFFYKAATINPIEQDILHNLAEVAKKLDKEAEVKELYDRLIQEG